jgi:hypothetical protein
MKTMKTPGAGKSKLTFGLTTIAIAIGALYLASPAHAGSKAAPGHSSAFGKRLATWEEIWTRWAYGDITVPTDANGNAVVGDGTILFPTPFAIGDGTPAHLDVTLNNSQSFILPLWLLVGTSYTDGTAPDPFEPDSVFQTLDISFTIDGVTVVDGNNAMSYYSKFTFDPTIPVIDFPPYDSIIWFQGVGVTHAPLTPGTHTFVLHAKNTQAAFGLIFEYNNTWTVTVLP